MESPEVHTSLKRLRNRYRLVVINEDTYEELVTFKLSRVSVYTGLSILFVLLVALTVALIAFTPLKLYIPGYSSGRQANNYKQLQLKADSIERSLLYKQQYIDNVEKVLKGNVAVMPDTARLDVKAPIVKKRKRRRR